MQKRELKEERLVPNYKKVYTPDTVQLDNIDSLLNKNKIDQGNCITILINSCKDLKADFYNYLIDWYGTIEATDERLFYIDIGNIARFMIWKFKSNETDCFNRIFVNAEIILKNGDAATQNLIVVGLFEGIQNIGSGHNVDYYQGFDKWLGPQSKKELDNLIELWEGE